jgi:TRAP-type mannitol/chloroaromatic compound transport system permease small subunit
MKKILRTIDAVNEQVGSAARWLALFLVLVIVNEVVRRYVFNSPTSLGMESMVMAGAAMYALSWGYATLHKVHVRVDVIYRRFSRRVQLIIDTVCFVLIFLPVIGTLNYYSCTYMIRAWLIGEKSDLTSTFPPIAPVRTIVFIGICLLMVQGIAQFVRDIYELVRSKPYD